MVIMKDLEEEEEKLKRWFAKRPKKQKEPEEREIAEGVIFVAYPRTEADRKALERLIKGYKFAYATKKGLKTAQKEGVGVRLKNAFMVPRETAALVETFLMQRGMGYKKWHVVVRESGTLEQPLSKGQKTEILKERVDEAIRTLMQKMDVNTKEEALMELFYKLRLSEYSPRQADPYGRMRSYVLKTELFPAAWKQAISKLKQRYGVNNSLLALALLLHQLGYIKEDPRRL